MTSCVAPIDAARAAAVPRFDRTLHTGENNYEKDPLVAHNVIHHGPQYPSVIVLPVVNATTASTAAGTSASGQ
jgi:hypothetical protein